MKAFRILALLLAAALVAVAAGCGGGGEEKAPEKPTAAGKAITVKLDEYSFEPKDVVIKRGGTVDAQNAGALTHNLTVEEGPDPTKKSKELAGTPTFPSDESEKLKVDLKPGKYALVCTVPGHRELGMTGTFTVR